MQSQDREVKLDIAKNVIGKQKNGAPLETIKMLPMTQNPAPPAGGNVIGLSYDFQPDGATFDPAIPVTFNYDPDSITDINNLKIAIWDDINEEWIPLDNCVVDTVNHTITGYTSHFTVFGVVELGPAEEEEVIEEEEEEAVEEEEEEVVEEEEEEFVEEEEEEVVEEEEEEAVEEEEEEVVTPTTGMAWWVWVIIGAAIIVVLALVYFLWWKRRLA
jgi:hypothetical protein